MKKYQTIFFDFDGVLCKDRFFTTLTGTYPEVYNFIQENIFWKGNDICDKRMRNEITRFDVNKYISEQTGIEYEILLRLFEESIRNMQINKDLIAIALQLNQQWKTIAIVTNNMDVFNAITIAHHKLDKIFPCIVNSCDHALLKHEQEGKLFDIAMAKTGTTDYTETLLIDDSAKARTAFEQKWWHTFPYTDFETFKEWADIHLL